MRVSVMRTPATLSSAVSRSKSSMQPRCQGRRAAKRWQYVQNSRVGIVLRQQALSIPRSGFH
jgi:hypothetical protein